MASIYPPHGPQDLARAEKIPAEQREYLDFSLEFCGKILDRRPEHPHALEIAAFRLTELGFYTDALLLDQRLAGLRPGDPAVFYDLACSYALVGLPDAAIEALARAVRYGYRDARHMSVDDDLKSLRQDPRFKEIVLMLGGTPKII